MRKRELERQAVKLIKAWDKAGRETIKPLEIYLEAVKHHLLEAIAEQIAKWMLENDKKEKK